MKDYYAILEVSPTASQEAIREQYLLLIQAWHPDKFPNAAQKAKAEEKCKPINLAYEVLKDARKRARYDRELKGQPSRSGEEERRQQADEQRRRRHAEEVERQQAEERQKEQAAQQRSRTDYQSSASVAEEWIRVYFEQARRRQAGELPAGGKHDSREPIRVLIFDDAADVRARVRNLLSNAADIRVVGEAPDGLEAVRQFDALTPDVTIVCINMPNLDGMAAAEAIRRKHPLAKVIIVSVQTSTGDIRRAAKAGACDYLIQPPVVGELHSAIRLAAGRPAAKPDKGTAK